MIISFFVSKPLFSIEIDCSQFKKLSTEYLKCTTKNLKEKTNLKVSQGKKKYKNSGIKDKIESFKDSKTLKDLIKN